MEHANHAWPATTSAIRPTWARIGQNRLTAARLGKVEGADEPRVTARCRPGPPIRARDGHGADTGTGLGGDARGLPGFVDGAGPSRPPAHRTGRVERVVVAAAAGARLLVLARGGDLSALGPRSLGPQHPVRRRPCALRRPARLARTSPDAVHHPAGPRAGRAAATRGAGRETGHQTTPPDRR